MTETIVAYIKDKKFPDLPDNPTTSGDELVVGQTMFAVYQGIRGALSPTTRVIIGGGSIEKCVGALAEQIVRDHEVQEIVVDLSQSRAEQESAQNGQTLTTNERLAVLIHERPLLAQAIMRGLLKVVR